MLKQIKHAIHLIQHHFRDLAVSAKRSGKWPTVEKKFLKAHPACEACGSKERLNAHHVFPFHLYANLELDPKNLITLCMSENECHIHIGHGGNWKMFNPNCRKDAAIVRSNPKRRDAIIKRAEKNRKS
jgi:5-methylcytosine-specific restriction protein A